MHKNAFKKKKSISYSKWGYTFILPFFIVYTIFNLFPLISTFYYSFFENYRSGLNTIGPNFVGLANYKTLFADGSLLKYANNTFIIWIMGFLPQIIISLLLASWFIDVRLKIKAQGFFKTVIYMPNLIMATAFSMLFFALFSLGGPVNNIMMDFGIVKEGLNFFAKTRYTRGLISLMNFLMWYGNTTILLMAGMMGIDPSLFESAEIDGCNSVQTFTKITLPLIRPILIYVLITSMIGGIQMFDVPQILTNGKGTPDMTSTTLVMFLNNHLFSKNYGMAGALSVILFIISAVLSLIVFKAFNSNSIKNKKRRRV